MSIQKSEKLKFLLNTIPPGFLVDGRFLRTHRFQSKSLGDYVSHGWLERIGWGVYRRPLPKEVTGAMQTSLAGGAPNGSASVVPGIVAVASMQRIMGYDFHVGGFSALQLFGHVHHLPLGGSDALHLYGKTPSWLGRVPLDVRPLTHTRTLFAGDATLGVVDADRGSLIDSPDLSVWHYSIRASTPERAILEAIDELPHHSTFDAVDQVFESLTMLRPKLLMQLLQACHSIKVKRLFFVLADHHRHAWGHNLDLSHVSLGSGPRALVEGGKLHPVYQIAVSERYLPLVQGRANKDPQSDRTAHAQPTTDSEPQG
jgi:hypothetical protein